MIILIVILGRITNVNRDGTYDIKYADGDQEYKVIIHSSINVLVIE
jgi:hypothetical protein